MLLNQGQVKAWAKEQYDAQKGSDPNIGSVDEYAKILLSNILNVSYAMLVFTGILGMTLVCGYLYRDSTIDRTFLRTEAKRAQKDIEESNRLMQDAIERNTQKRLEYEMKYPEMAA